MNLKWIINQGLDFNQFFTLLHWDQDLGENSKIMGWKLMLSKQEYLDNTFQITEKGENILKEWNNFNVEKKSSFNISVWCENVVEKMTEKLVFYQYKTNLKGFGGLTFLCNAVELEKHLNYFWKVYKNYKDLNKIEKILIQHVKTCALSNKFSPACKYFIYKNVVNTSYLGSEYSNFEEEIEETKELIDTKTLF